MAPAKRLEDLPQFLVSSIEQGEHHPTGYIHFKVHGTFDRPSGVRDGRCWLLLAGRNCLIGDLASLDPEAGTAIFLTSEETVPDVLGARLPYVDGYWQAYHIWMVVEPSWRWNRVLLQRRDVVGEIFHSEQAQTIQGHEVKTWIRVKEPDRHRGKERIYPVFPGDSQTQTDEVIATGWNHEHCELCSTKIRVGDYGFVDLGEHWVCEGCYAKYITTHDLSFLDA